jgi:REP element-mobilizing transposase RayT
MQRPLRIEYAGAIYYVLNRGDRREAIFLSDADRELFLETLGQACARSGWQVHAWCLMSNHFHLVLETPRANLAAGMKWFLGTYTQRFNRRHDLAGHLFQGRYKAQVIDGESRGYLRAACDYVHLNPERAKLIKRGVPLRSWRWSSYAQYLGPKRRLVSRRAEAPEEVLAALRRGWRVGAEDFIDRLVSKVGAALAARSWPDGARGNGKGSGAAHCRGRTRTAGLEDGGATAAREGGSRKGTNCAAFAGGNDPDAKRDRGSAPHGRAPGCR